MDAVAHHETAAELSGSTVGQLSNDGSRIG